MFIYLIHETSLPLGDWVVAVWILRAFCFDLFCGLAVGFVFFSQVFEVLPSTYSSYSLWLDSTSGFHLIYLATIEKVQSGKSSVSF